MFKDDKWANTEIDIDSYHAKKNENFLTKLSKLAKHTPSVCIL